MNGMNGMNFGELLDIPIISNRNHEKLKAST
jgi:hypothetical protein